MPRHHKKRPDASERNQHTLIKITDFTVYDYEKVIKPKIAWHSQVKQITGQSAVEQSKPEQEISDDWFEDCDTLLLNTKESTLLQLSSKSQGSVVRGSSDSGNTYPVDVWFMIGDFILPEDIGAFSRICHGTHVVVHSVRFWVNIYRRFCRSPSITLPPALQRDSVEQRIHGLRTRVVRALFLAYPPLSCRVSHRSNLPASVPGPVLPPVDPEFLVGRRCVMAWYERPSSIQWRFLFRFDVSRRSKCRLAPRGSEDDSSDPLLAPDDVLHNVDERSVILVAIASSFVNLPAVMGQVLVRASVSIDGMFARRLKLVFNAEYVHIGGRDVPNGAVVADIDSLLGLTVLHWWDSSFPSSKRL